MALAPSASETVGSLVGAIGETAFDSFIALGSHSSLASMASAGVIAAAFLMIRRKGRRISARAFLRALFPRRWLMGPSAKADLGFVALNTFMTGALIGWGILSAKTVKGLVSGGLTDLMGATPLALPAAACAAVATVVLFLAYELGYWVEHSAMHRVPFLWAFHKVHHTAETLSPLTNFRMHPVEGLVFANIIALTLGTTAGVLVWALGPAAEPFTVSGTNVIMLGMIFALIHLQHSQVWIAWRGWAGRVLMSPAHHQIHHSTRTEHFDRNFGGTLCLFDWLFGTLHMPALKRERLNFGVEGAVAPHSVTGGLATPFVEAVQTLRGPRPVPAGEAA